MKALFNPLAEPRPCDEGRVSTYGSRDHVSRSVQHTLMPGS
jgi:hypothetical protein